MNSKGVIWLPLAIGIIILVEVLIFSSGFTKVSIFSRETVDANIVFEGDQLETYARAIENAVQLSIAQSLYDFYLGHQTTWQNYESVSIPDPLPDVQKNTQEYSESFLSAFRNFPPAAKEPNIDFPTTIGTGKLAIDDEKVSIKFDPEIVLNKNAFGTTTFTRKFSAESTLVTYFDKMMDRIRKLLNDEKAFTNQALNAIGFEKYEPDTSDSENPEPGSYLNHQRSPEPYSPEPSSFSFLTGQSTQGYVEYCSTERKTFSNDNTKPSHKIWDPKAEDVYKVTHEAGGYSSAESKIMTSIENHVMGFLQLKLDKETTDYTVAFSDFSSKAKALGSCFPPVSLDKCGICECVKYNALGECILWGCNVYKSVTCQYSHSGAGTVKSRFQEDGFVYGFRQGADNVKLVFTAIFGNLKPI